MTTTSSRRQRAWQVALSLILLLVGIPAMLIYGVVVQVPRDVWRYLRWSTNQRLSDALPSSGSHMQRAERVEALLAQVQTLDAEVVDSDLIPSVVAHAEIRRFTKGAPSIVQDALEALRFRAIGNITRRAAEVAPQALEIDSWNVEYLNSHAWLMARDALISATSAALLGDALDTETRARWTAGWHRLTTGGPIGE